MKSHGFTIVELVMTLILIAILAAALMPRAPSKESVTLAGRAQQLAADIRYAQSLAMTTTVNSITGTRHGYCVRLTGSTYAIERGYDVVTAANNCITLVEHPAGVAQPVTLCNGCMTLTNLPSSFVQFDGLGTPYSAATTALASDATIQLSDSGGTKTVTITAVTGRVIVQ